MAVGQGIRQKIWRFPRTPPAKEDQIYLRALRDENLSQLKKIVARQNTTNDILAKFWPVLRIKKFGPALRDQGEWSLDIGLDIGGSLDIGGDIGGKFLSGKRVKNVTHAHKKVVCMQNALSHT